MKRLYIISILLCLCNVVFADDGDFVEVRADRTVIYPQRMELCAGATLMDVLEMYPELLAGSRDDVLNNYQLRMDNVKMSGDTRLLLTQIRAKDVKTVQIVDNPGVAKGTTGIGGVIDVTLQPMNEGKLGFAEVRGETKGSLNPTLNLRCGSSKTDLWANANYGYSTSESTDTHREYVDVRGITTFGRRDRLLTYFKQEYGSSDAPSGRDVNRNYLARARYFHTFNELGTELLTLLGYQYTVAPHRFSDFRKETRTQTPMYLLELNTPLFMKDFTMMLGAEGDFNIHDFGARLGEMFDEESRYRVYNQDFYLQFNYGIGPFKFTVGDRVMLYHYDMDGYSGEWSRNTARNMFQAAMVCRPHDGHQLQLGYYRRLVNPAYLDVFPERWPAADGTTWNVGNPLIDEEKVDQAKVGYVYAAKNLSLCVNGNYFNRAANDVWRTDVSLYYGFKWLTITAGANAYNEAGNDYYDVRLSPKASLPHQIRVAVNMICYSKNAPYKSLTGTSVYGELRADKQFNSHWDLQLLWHDIFADSRSSLMVSVKYMFCK